MTDATDLAALARAGAENLARVIAIDSQSDERSETIPSTEGQVRLAEDLERFFGELGFQTERDDHANLIVDVPGTAKGAKLCFMVHMDTARGTRTVDQLSVTEAWDGGLIRFTDNDALEVSVERFAQTQGFVGEDLLHGPGDKPIGLDDKLGMSELMTLAQVLAQGGVEAPDLVFVCRPDEEIGRMAAVTGLAAELKRRGVTHGYTVDGIAPFEVNVENFHASRAFVRIEGQPVEQPPLPRNRRLQIGLRGCKSHGATAKAEGYRNATVLFARAFAPLSRRSDCLPIGFASDPTAETDATLTFLLRGEDEAAVERCERALLDALDAELRPHAWKGAGLDVLARDDDFDPAGVTDEVARTFAHLATFLRKSGPEPLLSEDSEGHQGYSNPCFVHHEDGVVRVEYRLRDFDRDALTAREDHVRAVAAEGPGTLPVEVEQQYVNMGPRMRDFPELVRWARAAAEACEQSIVEQPIRGGTGVDPFLDQGIPVANLGTGYFAPESEKELTSRQNIGRHARWLVELVREVARDAG
jgi:tripeptide aminopeptidase